jgi:tol-pal system protein YbgF
MKRPAGGFLQTFFMLLFPALFLGGCALQSSLVTLEQAMEEGTGREQELKDDLDALRKLVGSLEKEVHAEKKPANNNKNSKGLADLIGQVNSLKAQLRQLEGRIEEGNRKASEAMRTADDQTHLVQTFADRLLALEKRLPTDKPDAGTSGALLPPTEAYTLAYNDYLRGNYDLAILSFQNYLTTYPNAASVPQAIYWVGQSYYNKAAYADAVTYFEQIENRFPQHDMAPNAMLKRGLSLVELSKLDLAKLVLKGVIERYPQSNEANLAKDKLATLQ